MEKLDAIPPERSRQFDLIEMASARTLEWASKASIPLKHIEPVVPFVETDFSLDAWLFFDTEANVEVFSSDGSADKVAAQFRTSLAESGYPAEWLSLVVCHFASKEVVDRDYQGSFYYFLR